MKFPVRCPHCREQVDMTFDLIGTDGNCQLAGSISYPLTHPGSPGPLLAEAILGGGGMGIVFAAHDTALSPRRGASRSRTSISAITGRHKIIERFKTEIRAIERLNHVHICGIFESGKWDDHLFYTMRFLEGGTLAGRMRDSGPA